LNQFEITISGQN